MRKLSAAVCVLSAAVLCQTAIQAKDIVPQPYNSSNFEKVFRFSIRAGSRRKTTRKRRITSRSIRSSRFCAPERAAIPVPVFSV